MSDEFDIPDLDDLLGNEQSTEDQVIEDEELNYLFIGRRELFDELKPMIDGYGNFNFKYTKTMEEAIDLLLVDLYAMVLIDNEDPDNDIITLSRIVRVNHPLARIIGLSDSKKSLFIADIINHGSVDAYLPLPADRHELINILSEQQAKHDIDRMLTNFVSQPPEMSAASYLLLDPSLSANEDEPVKFVGMMISYESVPRYSKYFEDLLAKDEILFAGYLSGITMLGQELLKSKDPLKEINFGGISVIFRFVDDIQFSIFVRNLSKHNVKEAEETISNIIDKLLDTAQDDIASNQRLSDQILDEIDSTIDQFQEGNKVKLPKEIMEDDLDFSDQDVMLYGTDMEEIKKIQKYMSTKVEYNTVSFEEEDKAKDYLKDNDPAVLVIDSDLENKDVQSPLAFADFVKDEYPYTQVIYLMRDRRASGPIIRSLNSGAINYMLSYRSPRKELREWIEKGIEKSLEIRRESEEQIDGGLNSALVAKTKIRKNEESYLTENQPVLEGMFIAEDENPIFKIFWTKEGQGFDDHMLAGLVASLESVSGEMFYDDNAISGLELGTSNIVVKHRDKYNIVYFVNNIGSHNVNLVNKHLEEYTDRFYTVIQETDDPAKEIIQSVLDTKANNILSEFSEVFTSVSM